MKVLRFLLLLLLLCPSGPVQADDVIQEELRQQRQRLEAVESEIAEQRLRAEEVAASEKTVLGELAALEARISRQWEQLDATRRAWTQKELALMETQESLAKQRKALADLRRQLERRLRAYYQMGTVGTLNVLFAADSFPEMISREAYIRRILSRDKDLRGRYRRRLAELKATAARLERDRAALKKAAARLEAEALRLEERKREREAFVQELRQQGERYRALLAELESAKQSLEAVIGQLSRAVARAKAGVPDTAAFEAQKGRLLPPVRRGRLLYSTSKADDAAGHLVLQGAGVVFGAPYGSEIRAVFDGHVVYNDVLPGYGKVLIIDHGEGFYSLVAQGAKYFKAVGDEVSEGETVGLVGGGPWADEGVYFEIRYKGKAEDPLAWLDREVLDQMAAQAEQP